MTNLYDISYDQDRDGKDKTTYLNLLDDYKKVSESLNFYKERNGVLSKELAEVINLSEQLELEVAGMREENKMLLELLSSVVDAVKNAPESMSLLYEVAAIINAPSTGLRLKFNHTIEKK